MGRVGRFPKDKKGYIIGSPTSVLNVSLHSSGLVRCFNGPNEWEDVTVLFCGVIFWACLSDITKKKEIHKLTNQQEQRIQFSFQEFGLELKTGTLYILSIGTSSEHIERTLPLVLMSSNPPETEEENSRKVIFLWNRDNHDLGTALNVLYQSEIGIPLNQDSLKFLCQRFASDNISFHWLYVLVSNIKKLKNCPNWQKDPTLIYSVNIISQEIAETYLKETGDFVFRCCTSLENLQGPDGIIRPLVCTFLSNANMIVRAIFTLEEAMDCHFYYKADLKFLIRNNEDGTRVKQPVHQTNTYQTGSAYNTGFPPTGQNGFPPTGQNGFSPTGQSGFSPTGQSGFSPTEQSGFSQTGQRGFSPTGQSGFPPTEQSGLPPTGQNGFSPTGQSGFPPTGQNVSPPTGQTSSNVKVTLPDNT